ncbi:MAG TPA: family 20 glycosylhydrolase [Chitinophagaceae bacterium]|nr:family 20 glycosylhydrolase [Chitinophagaceae bacterium]
MRRTIIYFNMLLPVFVSAQEISIIPLPAEMKTGKGRFSLSKYTVLLVRNGADDPAADFLNTYLEEYYGFKLKKVKQASSGCIELTTLQTLVPGKEGAYTLTVTPKGIAVMGQTASGTFYGMQTILQLLPAVKQSNATYSIPVVTIKDEPRFGYRGLHLDVSRHFLPVSYVKKYIDFIALHKMNYFHWHLTDDQGWRIEIKKYPKLTEVGAWRDGTIIGRYPGTGNDNIRYGGFYTQEQVREVVQYAADRFITVIPEIDMPGHSLAALTSYPQLGTAPESGYAVAQTWGINDRFNNVLNPTEYTFSFVEGVLDEVIGLFPSKYIHIGGDEASKRWWHESPSSQKIMQDNGLKDENELQSYFVKRVEKFLNSKGRTLMGWDEILEGGLAPNAIVMSWRGEKGGIAAAKEKHFVILCPEDPLYLNHSQTRLEDSITQGGYGPLENVYKYEPIPKELNEEEGKYVMGAQGNLWSEYIGTPSKAEYQLFPRLSALSEILWSPKAKRNWTDFEKRLLTQFKRYDLWKINYSRSYFELKATVLPAPAYQGISVRLETKTKNPVINQYNTVNGDSHSLGKYTGPVTIKKSGLYHAELIVSGKKLGSFDQPFYFNKATGKSIRLVTEANTKYPGDGAFTLVNGIQNTKRLIRSTEFLGFLGTDCEATIDLGKETSFTNVSVHILEQPSSWIYAPSGFSVSYSTDGKQFNTINCNDGPIKKEWVICSIDKTIKARYVKVIIRNYGTIPTGSVGAGNKAWLFVDEITID